VIRKGYNALFPGITADGKDEDGKDELEKISLDLDDEPEFISPTKFDLSTIKSGDNVFIIGKHDNHSVIKKILEMHDSVPINTIVTPLEFIDNFYRKKLSDQHIVNENYSPALIKQYVDYKRENIRSFMVDDTEGFVILYNCLNRELLDDIHLTDLLDNSQVYQSITVISASNPSTLTKVKSNIDYLCIITSKHILYKQIIYDEYIKNLMSYKNFSEILMNHKVILIDFKNTGNVYYIDEV